MATILSCGFMIRWMVVRHSWHKLYNYLIANKCERYFLISKKIARSDSWSYLFNQVLQTHKWTFKDFWGEELQQLKNEEKNNVSSK
jgi:hypothetical protein